MDGRQAIFRRKFRDAPEVSEDQRIGGYENRAGALFFRGLEYILKILSFANLQTLKPEA